MGPGADIRLLKRNEIDDGRWNNCICNASNGIIYSYTWYLDRLAENWFGLVYKDYQFVMAVPYKKKAGIRYVYHPALVPQLGVIGNDIPGELPESFIRSIPPDYKLIDYTIINQTIISIDDCKVTPAVNYTLSLHKPYDILKKQFTTNTIRNIAKHKQEGTITKKIDTTDTINLAKKQFSGFPKNVLAALDKYVDLNNNCPDENKCVNYGYINEQQKLEAAASIMFSNNRIYYLVVTNSPEAKTKGASHKIIDAILKDHAGTDVVLDFEGSDIPGIASFYRGFGATACHYQKLYINRLNFLLRTLASK